MTASSAVKAETLIQAEREPPLGSLMSTGVEEEEEPPSKHSLTIKEKFFSHVPEKDWNDWKWQFRHRITTVEELAKYIPLSSKEQAEIKSGHHQIPLCRNPLLSFFD